MCRFKEKYVPGMSPILYQAHLSAWSDEVEREKAAIQRHWAEEMEWKQIQKAKEMAKENEVQQLKLKLDQEVIPKNPEEDLKATDLNKSETSPPSEIEEKASPTSESLPSESESEDPFVNLIRSQSGSEEVVQYHKWKQATLEMLVRMKNYVYDKLEMPTDEEAQQILATCGEEGKGYWHSQALDWSLYGKILKLMELVLHLPPGFRFKQIPPTLTLDQQRIQSDLDQLLVEYPELQCCVAKSSPLKSNEVTKMLTPSIEEESKDNTSPKFEPGSTDTKPISGPISIEKKGSLFEVVKETEIWKPPTTITSSTPPEDTSNAARTVDSQTGMTVPALSSLLPHEKKEQPPILLTTVEEEVVEKLMRKWNNLWADLTNLDMRIPSEVERLRMMQQHAWCAIFLKNPDLMGEMSGRVQKTFYDRLKQDRRFLLPKYYRNSWGAFQFLDD